MLFFFLTEFSSQSFSLFRTYAVALHCVRRRMYTHSSVARTYFLHSAYTSTFAHLHECAHSRMTQVHEKKKSL